MLKKTCLSFIILAALSWATGMPGAFAMEDMSAEELAAVETPTNIQGRICKGPEKPCRQNADLEPLENEGDSARVESLNNEFRNFDLDMRLSEESAYSSVDSIDFSTPESEPEIVVISTVQEGLDVINELTSSASKSAGGGLVFSLDKEHNRINMVVQPGL
ncbi:hypothetical protein Dalk_1876 [Desulfatibacillum aliphaticivorans]|uniref:Uncharacterized protein n=1 Tax=Desulfatibacillum aliphaticivorans TaxID=218208 RepID=B8FEP6_DESAL|nr:hypothetical protein [Desulfatibacillum aliphaticivorans]ACL03573.1 hypothetical protein Dalk_1876 [Desulfatibacillum aliphaticivorans]